MRVAYADPPYPGQAHLYSARPDYGGEVDHGELLGRLASDYDCFILHTSSSGLGRVLPLAPPATRVLAWVKGWSSWKPGISPAYAWEPILLHGHRPAPDSWKVRDWLACHPTVGAELAGAKPEAVCRWLFAAAGLTAEDTLDDLYPGTGAVGRAWERWRTEPPLDLIGPPSSQEVLA